MKHWLVPLLLVATAGCSPPASDTSAQAQCERQAENDPKVVDIYSRSNGNYTFPYGVQEELRMYKGQAFLRCMREKGLAPPGGVQPVQTR